MIKALIIVFSVLAGRAENLVQIAIAFIAIYGLFDLYDFVKKKRIINETKVRSSLLRMWADKKNRKAALLSFNGISLYGMVRV